MIFERTAASTSAIALAVVLIVVVVSAGAYIALSPGPRTSTVTSIQTSTLTKTSTVSSTTSAYLGGQSVTLNGAGATFPYPLISAWAYQYTQVYPNVLINYQSIGSGGGIAQITAKTVDFGASDAPLTDAQNAAAPGLLHIPETIGSVVPAYNLPSINTGLKFTGAAMADIFLGKVTMWNDPEIASLNPGATLPAQQILVVHRSDGSGTTFVFTDYLSQASSQWNTTIGKGTSVNWPVGLGAKGNEGVGGVIQGNKYSFGYLELAYTVVQKVAYGSVQNAAGNFILANSTTSAAAVAAAASVQLPSGSASWSKVSIVDTIFRAAGASRAYPITSFTYLLVYQSQTDQTKGKALADFLWWVVNSAQQSGVPLGYVPLPPSVVALNDATIKSVTYNGQPLYGP